MSIIVHGFGFAAALLALGLLWLGATTDDGRAGIYVVAGVLMLVLGLLIATGRLPLTEGALYLRFPT
ncbi:MAG: hypothetical protein ABI629_19775 [bacterium]